MIFYGMVCYVLMFTMLQQNPRIYHSCHKSLLQMDNDLLLLCPWQPCRLIVDICRFTVSLMFYIPFMRDICRFRYDFCAVHLFLRLIGGLSKHNKNHGHIIPLVWCFFLGFHMVSTWFCSKHLMCLQQCHKPPIKLMAGIPPIKMVMNGDG